MFSRLTSDSPQARGKRIIVQHVHGKANEPSVCNDSHNGDDLEDTQPRANVLCSCGNGSAIQLRKKGKNSYEYWKTPSYAVITSIRFHRVNLILKKLLTKLKKVAQGSAVMNIIVNPYWTAVSA
jgi:hypothetical protein